MVSLKDNLCNICKVPTTEYSVPYSVEFYPQINLNSELVNASVGRSFIKPIDYRHVMVAVNESSLKRIIRTFFENGFEDALTEAQNSQTALERPIIASFAKFMSKALYYYENLKTCIYPHRESVTIENMSNYSETRDWIRSYIRAIAWHPKSFKIAVAGLDDIIRIYTDESAVMPVLKSASQKWITSMAWRPFSVGEIAVGCQRGICLWDIENNMCMTRSSSSHYFLKHPHPCPITSIQWSADGSLLATSSIGDADVLIWSVDKMEFASLKRIGSPCSILKWSPDNSCLFSATTTNVFRIWSVDNKWTPERWTIKNGTVQSACWSPCSTFLVFVTSEDSLLYHMQFTQENLFKFGESTTHVIPIADLSKVCVGDRTVGGRPQALAWDDCGQNLAVLFKDSSTVAIFQTSINKFKLNISPSFFLTGIAEEYPSFICFQNKIPSKNTIVLSIGWSSGRIQYVPIDY